MYVHFTLVILFVVLCCKQQEDDIMEATEGLAEPSSLANLSVHAFAQLAKSDRVRSCSMYMYIIIHVHVYMYLFI